MLDIRLRSKASKEYLDSVKGKVLSPTDIDCMLTGPARVYKPDGSLLCIYLPKAIPEDLRTMAYPILHTIRQTTTNRGLASGSRRVVPRRKGILDPARATYRSYSKPVASSIIGMIEDTGAPEHRHCRQTAWTGQHMPQWEELRPYFQAVAEHFAEQVPDRYAAQMYEVQQTKPEWVIKDTPFSTLTINNTYSTGVHTDKGDLEAGFSCLSVLRRGRYTGGYLTFPEYRTAVNLKDGDLILMDAHEWHGNTELVKHSEDAERISTVFYFRTNITKCGTSEEEMQKAERRFAIRKDK